MTGGIAPRSTSSRAVRTLMELTMAMAVIVEPGPDRRVEAVDGDEGVGVRGAQVDHEVGLVQSRLPTPPSGASDVDCATEVTATTRNPRRRAPRAISTGTADSAAGGEDEQHVVRPEA